MPKRSSIATVACEPCRRRKTRVRLPCYETRTDIRTLLTCRKCDGERPTCTACHRRTIGCVYAIQPNTTRTAALKDKVQQLEASHGNLADLYWQLKHGSPEDVNRLVERIRSDEDLFAGQLDGETSHQNAATPSSQPYHTLEDTMQDARSTATPSSGMSESQAHRSHQRDGESQESMPLDPALRAPGRDLDPSDPTTSADDIVTDHLPKRPIEATRNIQKQHSPSQDTPMGDEQFELDYRDRVAVALRDHADSIRNAFAIQHRYLSNIFVLHDEAGLEVLLSAVDAPLPCQTSNAQLCELSGIAAACSQCCREMFDSAAIETFYGT